MAAETFYGFIKRSHQHGEFNFSELLPFVEEAEAHMHSRGKPNWHVPGFKKCAGRPKGMGMLPKTMKHPETGKVLVFPMFDFDRSKGQQVQATIVEAKCPKCGVVMERRSRRDGQGDIFACAAKTPCQGDGGNILACVAWADVKGDGKKKPLTKKGKGKKKVKTPTDKDQWIVRIKTLVTLMRNCVREHGMSLSVGYRTVEHLAKLTAGVTNGDPDEAFRLWISARVKKSERDKFDAAGLPRGQFRMEDGGENPGWYPVLARVLDIGLPVYLVGDAGTGKTWFAKWYAEHAEKELEVMVGSGDVAGRELWVTRRDVKGGDSSTHRGPAARACTNGDVLLLDEVDGFDPNSLLPLNSVLNGDKQLSVPVLGKLEVNPEVRVIAAANTNGREKSREFAARNKMDGAFLNRFAVVCRTDYEDKVDTLVAEKAIAHVFNTLGQN